MDRYDRLAASLIDEVEEAIQNENPELLEIVQTKEGGTFLHGVCYHELEISIASDIRQLVAYKVGRALAKDAARRSRKNAHEANDYRQVAELEKQLFYEKDARHDAESALFNIQNLIKDWDGER